MSKNGLMRKWIDGLLQVQRSTVPAVLGEVCATERGAHAASAFTGTTHIKLQLYVRTSCTVKRREGRAPLLQQFDSSASIRSLQRHSFHQSTNPLIHQSNHSAPC
jgi:hypothetical protein